MQEDSVNIIYAEAMLRVAKERGIRREMISGVRQLGQLVKEKPQFRHFLHNPAIDKDQKRGLVREVFACLNEPLCNLLLVLIDRGRTAYLESILESFLELEEKDRGIMPALFISSRELPLPLKLEVKEYLEKILKAPLRIEFRTDARIVGGFIFKVEDFLIDASLKAQLTELHRRLRAVPS